jgi:FkbM family methyltransferase
MLMGAAPWAIGSLESLLIHRLFKELDRTLASYDKLRDRLARLERALDEFANAADLGPLASIKPIRSGRLAPLPLTSSVPSSDEIVYHTVKLSTGTRYEIAIDARWTDPITSGIVHGDAWFLDDFYVLLDLVQPGDMVLDLGGHIGTFALAAAALGCRVVCVEAAPGNVALLNAAVARNGFDRMRVVWGAVTERDGTLTFLPHGPWGTIMNPSVTRSPDMIRATELAPVEVPALTGDQLMQGLDCGRIDFVKMDIEGSEVSALQSMPGVLADYVGPTILYESNAHALSFFGETPRRLAATLRGFGYTSYLVKPGQLVPILSGDFQPECVTNCLAVKGSPPRLPGRGITPPRSHEEVVRSLICESLTAPTYERAALARGLKGAEPAFLTDPGVAVVLRLLRNDTDEAVRAAASWSAPAGSASGRG